MEKNEFGSILHTVYLINPKLTIELNAKLKVTKALDEIRKNRFIFLYVTLKVGTTKAKK